MSSDEPRHKCSPGPLQEPAGASAWDALTSGDPRTSAELLPLVYDELLVLARRYLRRERAGHSIQPIELVHEAYLRLTGRGVDWQGRCHFVALGARAMRRILVDHARSRAAVKRGGELERVTLGTSAGALDDQDRLIDALDLEEALTSLERLSERQARVVELRFFGGLTAAEAARALGTSTRTAEEDWVFARAWLRRALTGGAERRTQ